KVIRAYSANRVSEYRLSLRGAKLDPDNILVLDSQLLGIGGSEVNVPLGDDNALGNLYLSAGTYKLAGSASGKVARFSYRSCDAYRPCVSRGKLDLSSTSAGTEYRYIGELLL